MQCRAGDVQAIRYFIVRFLNLQAQFRVLRFSQNGCIHECLQCLRRVYNCKHETLKSFVSASRHCRHVVYNVDDAAPNFGGGVSLFFQVRKHLPSLLRHFRIYEGCFPKMFALDESGVKMQDSQRLIVQNA